MKFKPGDIAIPKHNTIWPTFDTIEITMIAKTEAPYDDFPFNYYFWAESEISKTKHSYRDYTEFIDENYVLDKSNRLKRLIDEI